MKSPNKSLESFKSKFKFISTILSWTIFVLLIICALFLVYYFIATKIYEKKGSGYEPVFSLYTIISPSMVPNINVYDVVVDAKVNSPLEIKVGDVISFNSSDFEAGKVISVTHRVVEVLVDNEGKYSYSTKGDNNFVKDTKPVLFDSITGKVVLKIPQLGRIQFFLASKAGWLLIVVVPALYIIIKDILKVLKIMGKTNKLKNNKLFMPIKKKKLYLPFNGYRNENGEKEKVTLKSLIPFTIENNLPKKQEKLSDKEISLEQIYKDLENLKK